MSLQSLKSHHFLMMHDLAVIGMKAREVCDKYDFDEGRLSIIRQTPLWIEKEDKMRNEALGEDKARMEALRTKAIDALEETVISQDEGIKLRSAKEILDRTGIISGVEIKSDIKPSINLYIPNHWNNEEPS